MYSRFLTAFLALVSIFSATASANWPVIDWEKTRTELAYVGGVGPQTTDGGYIITGQGSPGAGLLKTDPNGDFQWVNKNFVTATAIGRAVEQTTDGGYIIAGEASPSPAYIYLAYLTKTDPNGDPQWEKTFTGGGYAMGYCVQQTADGEYMVVGTTQGPSGWSSVYLLKTDPNGDLGWEKTFNGPDPSCSATGWSGQQTTDGGYIVAGDITFTDVPSSPYYAYLVKTDPNGDRQWEKILAVASASGSFGGASASSVEQTTDGGYILTGVTSGTGPDATQDVFLVKTNAGGDIQWFRAYDSGQGENGRSVRQTTDGGYIVAGYSSGISDGGAYLMKTDSARNFQWEQILMKPDGRASTIHRTSDGGFIIAATRGVSYTGVDLIKIGGDRDGDGLFDGWETDGIDIGSDGTIDLDLGALGADPNHKDLFIEVDAMIGRVPAMEDFNRVRDAFANVPNTLLNNPDGIKGIKLHIQLDETNIPRVDWPNAFADFDAVKANLDPNKPGGFGTTTQRRDPNWANIRLAKALAYRYCIFANSYSGTSSSGLSEYPGNDFMVTLGNWDTPGGKPKQQTGTFMHELGHTLGLVHGGSQYDPGKDYRYNWKPNFHSVMNYLWQFPRPGWHIDKSWQLDYSREAFPDMNEASLNEPAGIGGHVGHKTVVGPLPRKVVNENGPVDWNRDGDTIDPAVSADINRLHMADNPTPGDVLKGYSDWPNLRYPPYGLSKNYQDGVHDDAIMHNEMSFEMYLETGGCGIGDLDCDGRVDCNDLSIFCGQWCQEPGSPSADIAPIFEGDGIVNMFDLAVLAEHWLENAAD